ncbi:IclR family transcriptional regulator domain-containing protein [Actinokineospora enzanensis]|uniref:IclR family transcriptional regulator domain-containing protein n=1 Tax=Actinokineospora enzanensis TaxID=155975 RepID=UPI0003686F59
MSVGQDPTDPPAAERAEHGEPDELVAPLVRGVAVLRALTDAEGSLAPSELRRATGLARATVDRLVTTLDRMGYVRVDDRAVVLAPPLMALGNAYLAATGLPDRLARYVRALADEVDESVSLAVGDGDGVRFVHQVTRRRAMSLTFRIGDLLPAERTAAGTVTAIEWDEQAWQRWRARRAADPHDRGFPAVAARPDDNLDFPQRTALVREHGWAIDDQLIEPGLIALAVPVRAPDGRIACAASVVSHTSRHDTDSLRADLLPALRATASAMEAELAAPHHPEPDEASGLATWTGASKQELGRDFVESLARGLTVLTAFGQGRAALTLTAVAEATGLARATARRALITLTHLGYVAAEGRVFRPTPKVLGLGFPALSRTTLARIANPHLTALSEQVGDSSAIAVLDEDHVHYIARAATSRIMSVEIAVGTRSPATATALGRVLLADRVPEVADAGYALVDGELEAGLRSVAVPIRDRAGKVVAAVNVATHSGRREVAELLAEVLPRLRAAAARIEHDLHVTARFAPVPPG